MKWRKKNWRLITSGWLWMELVARLTQGQAERDRTFVFDCSWLDADSTTQGEEAHSCNQ